MSITPSDEPTEVSVQPVEVKAEKPARKTREITFQPFRRGVKLGGRAVGLGSAGDDVVRLQKILNRRLDISDALVEDGLFGPKTEAEVRKAQKSFKIKADGVVDRQTWAALGW